MTMTDQTVNIHDHTTDTGERQRRIHATRQEQARQAEEGLKDKAAEVALDITTGDFSAVELEAIHAYVQARNFTGTARRTAAPASTAPKSDDPTLREENNRLNDEVAQLTTERDEAVSAKEKAEHDRDEAISAKEKAEGECETMRGQRDAAVSAQGAAEAAAQTANTDKEKAERKLTDFKAGEGVLELPDNADPEAVKDLQFLANHGFNGGGKLTSTLQEFINGMKPKSAPADKDDKSDKDKGKGSSKGKRKAKKSDDEPRTGRVRGFGRRASNKARQAAGRDVKDL